MKVWKFCLFFFCFLLLSSALGEDTVAEDIGVHQLERLVELLTSKECEDLLFTLTHPEENIFQRLEHLERLSSEKRQLDLKTQAKRDTSSAEDSEDQCRTALTDWMLRYGEQTYYDRLSRALQLIGRTDIALEVGKNINQDKALNLKRYVEGYHKYVSSLNIPHSGTKDQQKHDDQRVRTRRVRDLTWRDLDLVVERAPVAPYQKGPMVVVLPFLYGILLGFGGTLFIGVAVLFIIVNISHKNKRSRHPGVNSSKPTGADVMLEEAASGRTMDI